MTHSKAIPLALCLLGSPTFGLSVSRLRRTPMTCQGALNELCRSNRLLDVGPMHIGVAMPQRSDNWISFQWNFTSSTPSLCFSITFYKQPSVRWPHTHDPTPNFLQIYHRSSQVAWSRPNLWVAPAVKFLSDGQVAEQEKTHWKVSPKSISMLVPVFCANSQTIKACCE